MKKEIRKFPAEKDKLREKEAFVILRGIDIYDKIEFSDKQEQENFKKSMTLYLSCFNSEESEQRKKIKKAIAISKYNVEARISEILDKNLSELDKEQELIKLIEESAGFEEGWIIIKKEKINIFQYKISDSLADFYIFSKLYSKVDRVYEKYKKVSMKDEIFLPMFYKKLVAHILLSDFDACDEFYHRAKADEILNNDVIVLSRIFYYLLKFNEVNAVAFCKKLMDISRVFCEILDKYTEPSISIELGVGDEIKRNIIFIRVFSYFKPLFYKEYFFNFFMNVKESRAIISDNLEKNVERIELNDIKDKISPKS